MFMPVTCIDLSVQCLLFTASFLVLFSVDMCSISVLWCFYFHFSCQLLLPLSGLKITWTIMNFLAVQSNLSYKGRDSHLRRSPRHSLQHSPSPSPTPLARIPKSKSHYANLNRKFSKAPEKRHRSLERNISSQVNGVNPRETFRLVDATGRELAKRKGSGRLCSVANCNF